MGLPRPTLKLDTVMHLGFKLTNPSFALKRVGAQLSFNVLLIEYTNVGAIVDITSSISNSSRGFEPVTFRSKAFQWSTPYEC